MYRCGIAKSNSARRAAGIDPESVAGRSFIQKTPTVQKLSVSLKFPFLPLEAPITFGPGGLTPCGLPETALAG